MLLRSSSGSSCAPTRQRLVHICLISIVYVINSLFKKLEHLRITCDLMNFYFAFDEYTDVANKTEASKIASDVMDAFRRKEASVRSPHGKITTMAHE